MNFNHKIRITELNKQKQLGAFSDVVIHCRWELKSYCESNPSIIKTFKGAVPFKVKIEDLECEFTDFCNLEESNIIDWVENICSNIPEMKRKHETQILDEIENNYEVVKNPWDYEDLREPDLNVNNQE